MVNVAVAPQLLDLYAVLDLHMTNACSFHCYRYFVITNIMNIVIIISATTIIVIIINSLLDTDA